MEPISLASLMIAMPRLDQPRAGIFIGPLNQAMERWGVTTFIRQVHFLGQLRVESGHLRFWKELKPPEDGWHYDVSKNPGLAHALGNVHQGDGPRYIGRGPIQLTGRTNYREAGVAIGLDLEDAPELLEQPGPGFAAAGWFWSSRSLSALADQDDDLTAESFYRTVTAITQRINGGLTNLADRLAAVGDAKAALRRTPDFSDVQGGSSTV